MGVNAPNLYIDAYSEGLRINFDHLGFFTVDPKQGTVAQLGIVPATFCSAVECHSQLATTVGQWRSNLKRHPSIYSNHLST